MNGDPLIPYPRADLPIVALVAAYLLHFTVFGRYVYAIGGNRDAAEYSGITVKRVETLTYVISAGLARRRRRLLRRVHRADVATTSASPTSCTRHRRRRCSAAARSAAAKARVLGILIGSAIMKVIDNGIIMFQIRYHDAAEVLQTWKLGRQLGVHHHRRGDPDGGDSRPTGAHRPGTEARADAGEITPGDPDPLDRQRGFDVVPTAGIGSGEARRS